MSSSSEPIGTLINRRAFLAGAAAALVPIAGTSGAGTPDLTPVLAEIEKRHDESVRRIQEWIKQPTIAAENKGIADRRHVTLCKPTRTVKSSRYLSRKMSFKFEILLITLCHQKGRLSLVDSVSSQSLNATSDGRFWSLRTFSCYLFP